MAFHEIRFPDDISFNSRGGPGFNTIVTALDSGYEQLSSRWESPRWRYNARYGVKRLDQLMFVIEFYIARTGIANGFRYKDFLDFTTADDHRSSPNFDDIQIGVGDGSRKTFQLKKEYISGPITFSRVLNKPVSGTVSVALDGIPQGGGWSVDTTTGIITFTTAPSNTISVTAGCEFDVPVRFSDEIDEALQASIDSFDSGAVPDIPLIEFRLNANELPGDFFYGGSYDHGVVDADISISTSQGRVHLLQVDTASLKAFMPVPDDLAPGGPYFYLSNTGTESISLRTSDDVEIVSLASGGIKIILLSANSSNEKTWIAV